MGPVFAKRLDSPQGEFNSPVGSAGVLPNSLTGPQMGAPVPMLPWVIRRESPFIECSSGCPV
jgi:hypothetical protein